MSNPPPEAVPPVDTGRKCRKCGCSLTYIPEPVECPQCGTIYNGVQPVGLGGRLLFLNAIALLLALWVLFSPASRGFGWFPFDSGAVCILIPLQVVVALGACFAYIGYEERSGESRLVWIGAVAPFVLAALSFFIARFR